MIKRVKRELKDAFEKDFEDGLLVLLLLVVVLAIFIASVLGIAALVVFILGGCP